ncbi:phosphate ABC transporter ATP-binding protein [Alkaliphilus peptidifermentans]|uniref:Phosphate ABC transporter ATP-binding protein, PhoT family n=1 Tax=Alkaliphilus peptidifermentans DSM 18978 TaxID=1120976 RepID=A0A1G5CF32_9FIRM|nr:phosphate ABC transporter ATP-binding protein [Alkaliphilus peptidifermentans]SCY00914.1 phosphate ABC transporter ATP-binding protein, PhoT family [Alkaliphilus peptidifermentans DSM 18978]
MDTIININSLSVSFNNKSVLKDIDLNIIKNKITAIIGPSGCGKSTLLKTLNYMTYEDQFANINGDILFNKINIKEIPKEDLRRRIGLVFQNPTPFPISIYKNMVYGPVYYGKKDKKSLNILVEEKLKISGLYDEVKEDLNASALKLSGGQQQRLCIARALSVEPEVILLDEPCSSLDLKNTANIEKMLKNLSDDYTIIIVTHNLSQAKRISDYTAFILNGELIEYGETQELFTKPKDERTQEYIDGIFG